MSNSIGNSQNPVASFSGFNKPQEYLQVVRTGTTGFPLSLTASDVNKLYSLGDSGAAVVINVPAPSTVPGARWRFVVGAVLAGAATNFAITSAATNFHGSFIVNAAKVACTTKSVINIVGNGTALRGDFVEIVSDGNLWLVNGLAQSAGAITAP
jgi:hypothetical protein